MKPFISIIVPAYNAEKTLHRCVDSVLKQDFANFEIILVNDGSKDNTGAICDAYALQDSRIRVQHQENSGVSHTRNVGISMASGSYLFFLDSDDWIRPETLSVYAQALREHDCDVVVGGLTVHEPGKTQREDCAKTEKCFQQDLWEAMCEDSRSFGYAGGKMVRRSVVTRNSLSFCEQMSSQEDVEFLLSVYEHCDCVCVIPFAGYQYDYVPGKRNPPIWDFISNQIKLLRIAQKKTEITTAAKNCVHRRIASLLFSGLYDAVQRNHFEDMVRRISNVPAVAETLKSIHLRGEHGYVVRNFAAGKYSRIRRYFAIRNRVRNLARIIRRKTGR